MDVWKIGVSISMANGVSPVLSTIAADLLGLKGNIAEVEKGFSAWGDALKGAGAILAGGELIKGMADLVQHGNELVHIQEQLNATGVTQLELATATGRAWETSAKYGLQVADVLADIKEAQMVFGSTEHAMDFIDPLEKMRVVLNSVTEGSGQKARDAVYNMARAGELKGLQGPDQFLDYFDAMTKAITASGGKVDPSAFMQATQYGKLASKGWDEEFYTRYLPSLIQEMRPSTAGQSLMSLYQTFGQGRASKAALAEMEKIGLIADESKIVRNKTTGEVMKLEPGALQGTELLSKNPYLWAQQVLKPLLETEIGHKTAPGDIDALNVLGTLASNRNAAAAIAALTLEEGRLGKDANLIGRSQGLNSADRFLSADPVAVSANFHSAWTNMLTSFGAPGVQTMLSAMNSIAGVMKSITGLAVAHPDAVKAIGEVSGALSAALIGFGSVKMGQGISNLFNGGPLMGSATALNASAAALTQAAVALGGKGVITGAGNAAVVTGGKLDTLARVVGSLPFVAYAFEKFAQGSADVEALSKQWNGVNVAGKGMIAPGAGRKRNPFAPGQPGVPDGGEHPIGDSIRWFDMGVLRSKLDQMKMAAPPPPVINVTPPPPATMTGNVVLNGSFIGMFTAAMAKAIGAGMPNGPASPNTRALVPTVDGAGSN